MKLSYAVTVCNEFEETINLITTLLNYKGENSEVVVLLDMPKASEELVEYLELQANANHIELIESEFNNDFQGFASIYSEEELFYIHLTRIVNIWNIGRNIISENSWTLRNKVIEWYRKLA
jgi:hypothetical protein